MGSKKIIVPQGLINPNETTIIEIPAGVDSEATLIARSSPRCGDPEFVPTGGSSACTSRRITASAPPSPRCGTAGSAGGRGGGAGGGGERQKTVRKVTSTTISSGEDPSSFGILSPGAMNNTDYSSFGLMPGAQFDNSRNTTQSSYGLMSGAHFDNSRNTTQSSLGLMPGAHFDCSRNTTESFGLLPGGHFDFSRNTTPSSLGSPGARFDNRNVTANSLGHSTGAHFDNTRNVNQSCSPRCGSGGGHFDNARNIKQSCSSRGAAGGSGGNGGGGQRTVRKVTSTTIINDDDSSLGVLSPGAMNDTNDSSFGLMPGGHFDRSGNTTQSSLGLMPGVHFDNTRNTTQSSLGVMDSGYMDLHSTMRTPSPRRRVRTSPGTANEYYDNNRTSDPNSFGSPACMDSSRSSGNSSPRRVKKIVKKVVTESSPKSPNEGGSQQYHSPCSGSSPPPSPINDSKRNVTTVTSETIIDEGEDSSLGTLGPGYFDSTRLSGSLGILGSGYMDNTQESCDSNPNSQCPARSSQRSDDQGSNLTSEVQRHLRELEQTERTQINRDLAMFQQARRQLVQDATNISSSGESQVQFQSP